MSADAYLISTVEGSGRVPQSWAVDPIPALVYLGSSGSTSAPVVIRLDAPEGAWSVPDDRDRAMIRALLELALDRLGGAQ